MDQSENQPVGSNATMPMPPSSSMPPAQAAPQAVPQGQPPIAAMPAPAVAPPLAAVPVLTPTVPVHAVAPGQNDMLALSQSQAVDTGNAAVVPEEAADNDVIEREWVVKAKQIVNETRHDPYRQVQEMNKLRVAYMKKRYDKDIKLTED